MIVILLCLLVGAYASHDSDAIGILVVGETGAGKSTLINGLYGSNIAPVGHYDTGTIGVDLYKRQLYGQQFNIWDTRGFNEPAMTNHNISKMIIESCGKVHAVLICFDISKPRLTQADLFLEEQLFAALDAGAIGGKPVVVFTKANLNPMAKDVAADRLKRLRRFSKAANVVCGNDQTSINLVWKQMESGLIEFDFTRRRELCNSRTFLTLSPLPQYPISTTNAIMNHYNDCVERKSIKTQRNVFAGGVVSLLGFSIVGILTGGAGFMAGMAALGGGSLAAGGAGVAGGMIVATAAGMAVGGIASLEDTSCRDLAISRADILSRHADSATIGVHSLFISNDGVRVPYWREIRNGTKIHGEWVNNKPTGIHRAAGFEFVLNGSMFTMLSQVELNGKVIQCDWRMK